MTGKQTKGAGMTRFQANLEKREKTLFLLMARTERQKEWEGFLASMAQEKDFSDKAETPEALYGAFLARYGRPLDKTRLAGPDALILMEEIDKRELKKAFSVLWTLKARNLETRMRAFLVEVWEQTDPIDQDSLNKFLDTLDSLHEGYKGTALDKALAKASERLLQKAGNAIRLGTEARKNELIESVRAGTLSQKEAETAFSEVLSLSLSRDDSEDIPFFSLAETKAFSLSFLEGLKRTLVDREADKAFQASDNPYDEGYQAGVDIVKGSGLSPGEEEQALQRFRLRYRRCLKQRREMEERLFFPVKTKLSQALILGQRVAGSLLKEAKNAAGSFQVIYPEARAFILTAEGIFRRLQEKAAFEGAEQALISSLILCRERSDETVIAKARLRLEAFLPDNPWLEKALRCFDALANDHGKIGIFLQWVRFRETFTQGKRGSSLSAEMEEIRDQAKGNREEFALYFISSLGEMEEKGALTGEELEELRAYARECLALAEKTNGAVWALSIETLIRDKGFSVNEERAFWRWFFFRAEGKDFSQKEAESWAEWAVERAQKEEADFKENEAAYIALKKDGLSVLAEWMEGVALKEPEEEDIE